MATALSTAVRSDLLRDLIILDTEGDPFQKMKACSVITHCELTLQRVPWSGLQMKNERGPSSLRFSGDDADSGRWMVSTRGSGLPGTYERSVYRALEWIAIGNSVAQRVPFRNPLIVHPREICERLCWRTTQPQFEAIEKAMRTLCEVEILEIEALSAPPRKLGILRSVIAGSRRSARSSAACPHFVVYFDRHFEESVNSGKIVPMNWGLWIALRNPVAQRLLELLELQFAKPEGPETVRVQFDELGELLPLNPALGRPERCSLLEQAHLPLIRRGYLRKVEWECADSICYRAGPTVMAMRCHPEMPRWLRLFP